MGESSKKQDKQTGKASAVKNVLKKRINVTPSSKLNRDVKAPKWLRAIKNYFVGAAKELKQVKWPSRRATWGLTMAVILFTAFMVIIILLLDYGFEQLFKQVLL